MKNPFKNMVTILSLIGLCGYVFAFRSIGEVGWKPTSASKKNPPHLKAFVMAPSNYIIKGDVYQAHIMLADVKQDTTERIYMGELKGATKDSAGNFIPMTTNPITGGSKVDITNGIGNFWMNAGAEGEQTFQGAIEYTVGKTKTYFPFESKFNVGSVGLVISPDKMNVFYVGVDNPVSIAIPGFAADKLIVTLSGFPSMDGGKIIKDEHGGFVVRVTNMGNVSINVSAIMPDGSTKIMGSRAFRCKQIPTPNAGIPSMQNGTCKLADFKLQSKLTGMLNNFDYDISFPITHVSVIFIPSGKDSVQHRTLYTGDLNPLKDLQAKAKPKDIFLFKNMECKMPDGSSRKLQAIYFEME